MTAFAPVFPETTAEEDVIVHELMVTV